MSIDDIGLPTADYGSLVLEDRVHTSLYTDADLFDVEIEKVFKSTWIWVAHESDLPGPNTFKTSWVGTQPVIVTRDKAGQTHVLLMGTRYTPD